MEYPFEGGGLFNQIYPISSLPDLISDKGVAPLAYHLQSGQSKLAYYYNGKIRIVPIGANDPVEPIELIVENAHWNWVDLKFSQDGECLAFGYPDHNNEKGNFTVFNLNNNEITKIHLNSRSFSWNMQERLLAALSKGKDKMVITVFDSSLQKILEGEAPNDSRAVFWIDDQLMLLTEENYERCVIYFTKFQ